MPITLTKADLIDELAEVMSDTCDMDVSWSQYAKAVVERLEKLGIGFGSVPSPVRIEIIKGRRTVLPVAWSVDFDNGHISGAHAQTVPEALAAVQLAIDGMRDEK